MVLVEGMDMSIEKERTRRRFEMKDRKVCHVKIPISSNPK
jgi:hypothetical protein